MTKKLINLEGRTEKVESIGDPLILKISGAKAGIDYIKAFGCEGGIKDEDRERLEYLYLHKIEKNAPSKADSFKASKTYNLDKDFFLETAKAVQYFKLGDK